MKRLTLHTVRFGAACLTGVSLWAALALPAMAQSFPSKSLRIIEPAGPGSAVDVFARKLTTGLAQRLGQSVIVENRPGANSAIGAREAARAAPDGHTLFHANINNSLNDLLSNDACCRLNEALIPITKLTSTPLVLVVFPGVGVKTLKEYLALGKSQPQTLTFASGGNGSITQLVGHQNQFGDRHSGTRNSVQSHWRGIAGPVGWACRRGLLGTRGGGAAHSLGQIDRLGRGRGKAHSHLA
jgi:tripartite-type tricarboxylate transporter receptor subunit TctC